MVVGSALLPARNRRSAVFLSSRLLLNTGTAEAKMAIEALIARSPRTARVDNAPISTTQWTGIKETIGMPAA